MASIIKNKRQFFAALDKNVKQVETLFRSRVRIVVSEAMRRLLARTPVFTGQSVANYALTSGAAYSGPVKPGFGVVETTNDKPLGAELNRAKAEAVALATLSAVSFEDPFKMYHVTNSSPQIHGLEAGELPGAGRVSRSPAGMFRITNQELIQLLKSGNL